MSAHHVDAAIIAVTAAADATPTRDPAELAAQLGALAELCRHLEQHTIRVAGAYDTIGALRHDQRADPARVVTVIDAHLARVTGLFAEINTLLHDAHNHAARLAACATQRHRDQAERR